MIIDCVVSPTPRGVLIGKIHIHSGVENHRRRAMKTAQGRNDGDVTAYRVACFDLLTLQRISALRAKEKNALPAVVVLFPEADEEDAARRRYKKQSCK